MGTRADFYIGNGPEATWLGSVAWDGYEWHEKRPNAIVDAKSKYWFSQAVANMLADRKDATLPKDGWPWPWPTSALTDYTYVFEDDGTVHVYQFGSPVAVGVSDEDEDYDEQPKRTDWRDMRDVANVTMGPRSGLMVFGIPQGD